MRLDDAAVLKAFLQRHGLSADKSLGQHFLVSSKTVDAIVGCLPPDCSVLEIGPGPGVLTGALCQSAKQVSALELDLRMKALLAESAPCCKLRLGDALTEPLEPILGAFESPRAIVSNLPYYITAPLLQRVAEVRGHIDVAVLMMQKEVGERVMALAGNRVRGSLSVFLQGCFAIRKVAAVPAGAFLPPPKVDSVVLQFTPRAERLPEELFKLSRDGFSQPRKTLANNLAYLGKDRVGAALAEAGLESNVRPHQLEEAHWIRLHQILG